MVRYFVRVAGRTFIAYEKSENWVGVINYFRDRFPKDYVEIERIKEEESK